MAVESGAFADAGLTLTWSDEPGGTGAMMQQLRDGDVDVAVVLLEGALASAARHGDTVIIGTWVSSPLTWGIHVPAASELRGVSDLAGARFAVSRFGSGSHLIAAVHAGELQGAIPADERFRVVGTLEGARKAFAEGTADVFYWEQTMTRPLVDAGEWRSLGSFAPPWPAFVAVARRVDLERVDPLWLRALEVVRPFVADLEGRSERAVALIAERFGLQREDVLAWLERTRWASSDSVSADTLELVCGYLETIGQIDETGPVERFARRFADSTADTHEHTP